MAGLTGVHVPLVQVLTDVVVPNAITPSNPNRGQLTRFNEAIHRHVGNSELTRYLCHREETPKSLGVTRWWTGRVAHDGGSIAKLHFFRSELAF